MKLDKKDVLFIVKIGTAVLPTMVGLVQKPVRNAWKRHKAIKLEKKIDRGIDWDSDYIKLLDANGR